MPEPIAALYDQAQRFLDAAEPFHDRIVAWVPRNVTEAVALLEWIDGCDNPELSANVLAGLRSIASREVPPISGETALTTATPIIYDFDALRKRSPAPDAEYAMRLFRNWVEAMRFSCTPGNFSGARRPRVVGRV